MGHYPGPAGARPGRKFGKESGYEAPTQGLRLALRPAYEKNGWTAALAQPMNGSG